MNIRPSLPSQTPSVGTASLNSTSATALGRSDDRPGLASSPAANDQVVLSDAARRLHEGLAIDRPVSLLAGDRMRQILGRIAQGAYNHPDVREAIAERMQSDLRTDSLGD